MRSALNTPVVCILTTERERLVQRGMVLGKRVLQDIFLCLVSAILSTT